MRRLLLISIAISPGAISPIVLADDRADVCGDPTTPVVSDIAFIQTEQGTELGEADPSPVYYGTPKPTHVPLTPGQMMAIGTFRGCSGTVVADGWVLTAKHCGISRSSRFYIGEDPKNPNISFGVSAVYSMRSSDLVLVKLSKPVSEVAPEVEPIPLFTGKLDKSWIGETAEGSGYGNQETGRSGEREFTAEPIHGYESDQVVVNGEGKHGLARGDSGGPLMVIARDGTVRVVGALFWGDSSNVGLDRYTRVDVHREWVEGHLGPLPEPEPVDAEPSLVVNCPDGSTRHTSSTYAFRDRICKSGDKYMAYHEGTWWTWSGKLNATEMQFKHPGSGALRTFGAGDLAVTAAPGTVNNILYPEGTAVPIPEGGEPVAEVVREEETQTTTQGTTTHHNHNHGSSGGFFRRLFGR